MTDSEEIHNLISIRRVLDHHNGTCPVPAAAILLSPADHARIGYHELWGLPVVAERLVPERRVRISCGGSAWRIEDELDGWLRSSRDAA